MCPRPRSAAHKTARAAPTPKLEEIDQAGKLLLADRQRQDPDIPQEELLPLPTRAAAQVVPILLESESAIRRTGLAGP